MKFSALASLMVVLNLHSQAVVNLGPFSSSFPDPLSKSQEKRATSVDRKMLVKVTAIAFEAQGVKKFVIDYENSLTIISPDLILKKEKTDRFLSHCINYIIAKNSMAGNIPGLSKLAAKMKIISFFKTNKIRTLKSELNTLFKIDNYMTEGERKVILLEIIDRALKITI